MPIMCTKLKLTELQRWLKLCSNISHFSHIYGPVTPPNNSWAKFRIPVKNMNKKSHISSKNQKKKLCILFSIYKIKLYYLNECLWKVSSKLTKAEFSFCSHNIFLCIVYIYYVYINTPTCMYIFKKKIVYILNIFIYNINYMNINIYMQIFTKYILYVCIYNKYTQYTNIYYVNTNFYFGCD